MIALRDFVIRVSDFLLRNLTLSYKIFYIKKQVFQLQQLELPEQRRKVNYKKTRLKHLEII